MSTDDQYLKAIYLVQQLENGPASTGAVAERLNVSPATVTERISSLGDRDLLEHERYKGVELTDKGIIRARKAVETYCILEYFLANVLDIDNVQEEARQLQPVIDETVADRLDTIIQHPSECPDCFDPEQDKCRYLSVDSINGE